MAEMIVPTVAIPEFRKFYAKFTRFWNSVNFIQNLPNSGIATIEIVEEIDVTSSASTVGNCPRVSRIFSNLIAFHLHRY